MPLPKERIHYLLEAYISKKASAAEVDELMDWFLETGEDSELKSYMLDIWNQYKPAEKPSDVNWDEIYSRVMQPAVVPVEPKIRQIRWGRLTAAAVVLTALAAGTYLYFTSHTPQPIAIIEPRQSGIAPSPKNTAILTLADGTQVEIDSSGNGTLAVQENVRITKQSTGGISYSGMAAGKISYNTLTVPKGSNPLSLKLSDGSQVWLNVGSSLTYPTAFTGNERKVKIIGEAYFEVAHNAGMPFKVQHDDLTVSVIGTHFNMNTYDDENDKRITLLEGSVQVNKSSDSRLLKPGQQAKISDEIKILNDVNTDEVIAWKEGKFIFGENTDIGTIMRQIARRYNVEIEYRGNINQRFWGSVPNNVDISQVLKILESTGGVKFNVEGNKIIVMPATQ